MSVTARVRSGSEERRAEAKEEPMKPPAPVMSIDGIVGSFVRVLMKVWVDLLWLFTTLR